MMQFPAWRGRVAATLIMFSLLSAPACAGEVRAAVASNFAAAMERIAAQFKRESGHEVKITQDSTAKLYTQIRRGAAFDVFLAADEETPKRLQQEGRAVAGSRFVYAVGRLVLWSVQPDLVDDKGLVLSRGNFATLAIANPRYSPYGVATKETLEKLIMWNAIQRKLSKGDTVTETFQFAATEKADLAFVALSQVMRDGKVTSGSWWLVPPELHKPIHQGAVLLTGVQDRAAAEAFLAFLKTQKAIAIMRGFGYETP